MAGQLLFLFCYELATNITVLSTHGSFPTPLSQHVVHLLFESNRAIICLQEPSFCPGEVMIDEEH